MFKLISIVFILSACNYDGTVQKLGPKVLTSYDQVEISNDGTSKEVPPIKDRVNPPISEEPPAPPIEDPPPPGPTPPPQPQPPIESCENDEYDQANFSHSYDAFGAGTEEAPYRIHTAKQIQNLAHNQDALTNKYYIQCRNISFENFYSLPNNYYFTIGTFKIPFSGSYNGQGFDIEHFVYDVNGDHFKDPSLNTGVMTDTGELLRDNNDYIGLFGLISNGRILNLNIKNAFIDAAEGKRIALLAGEIKNHTQIKQVTTKGQLNAHKQAGGFVGWMVENSKI
jgi:hypothetical protein